jgi:hypothetical protein
MRDIRQWDLAAWQAAEDRLRERGWLGADGALTPTGTTVRTAVEARTDAAAERPWTALGAKPSARLAELLEPLTRTVLESGLLPSQNPVGLPKSGAADGR